MHIRSIVRRRGYWRFVVTVAHGPVRAKFVADDDDVIRMDAPLGWGRYDEALALVVKWNEDRAGDEALERTISELLDED